LEPSGSASKSWLWSLLVRFQPNLDRAEALDLVVVAEVEVRLLAVGVTLSAKGVRVADELVRGALKGRASEGSYFR